MLQETSQQMRPTSVLGTRWKESLKKAPNIVALTALVSMLSSNFLGTMSKDFVFGLIL